jgi:hypothetical protein
MAALKMGCKFHWTLPESDIKWRFYNYVKFDKKLWILVFKLWRVWGHIGVY